MPDLTKEEFHLWKARNDTQQVMAMMREERQEWVERLIYGKTLCGHGPTEQETAKAVGVIYGIDLFLEASWEEEQK